MAAEFLISALILGLVALAGDGVRLPPGPTGWQTSVIMETTDEEPGC